MQRAFRHTCVYVHVQRGCRGCVRVTPVSTMSISAKIQHLQEQRQTDKMMKFRLQQRANSVFEGTSDIFTLDPLAECSTNRLYSYPSRTDVAAVYGNLIMLHEKAECRNFNQSMLVHKCCNAQSSRKAFFFFSFWQTIRFYCLKLIPTEFKEEINDLSKFWKEFDAG